MEYSIWSATDGPAQSATDGQALTLATEFYVTSACWLVGLRFWRADLNITGPIQGRVWEAVAAEGTGPEVAAAAVVFALSGTGWQRADVGAPPPLTIGQRYRASCHFPGYFSVTGGGYWNSGPGAAGFVNGPLRAPNQATATSGRQGSYAYGAAPTYPINGSPAAASYWVDVVVTDVDPGPAPEPDPTDLYVAGRVRTGWTPGALRTGWSAGRTRTGWTPGRIV